MIRLIGIDVDGTLLDTRGQIPQANVDAIHDAVRAGIHVALVTAAATRSRARSPIRCRPRSR
jgi:hydroxymethylpyrimidine pyrophosphatase-like HAD family hydrolase